MQSSNENSNSQNDIVIPTSGTPILTKTRQTISPYLPPPVLKAIHTIDSNPKLVEHMGSEPSMTIFATLTLAAAIFYMLKASSSLIGSGRAVVAESQDEAEENVLSNLNKKTHENSAVLFGPSGSGKTVLFHSLLSTDNNATIIDTVTSIKANASVLANIEKESVRLVDYPGHVSFSSQLSDVLYPSGNMAVRGLLVVDSTKPVTEAAALLYKIILCNSELLEAWGKMRGGGVFRIMVVCNKADAPNAKNWRRIKIQMRSELEKVHKIQSATVTSNNALNEGSDVDMQKEKVALGLASKTIDLDNLGPSIPIEFHFLSVSSLGKKEGMEALRAFVLRGEVLADSTSILKSRKK